MTHRDTQHHDLLSGFIRMHILHHAAEEEIYGQWIIEELARHGYRLSPGTLYPMLHTMERRGYLKSREERIGSRTRRLYTATKFGAEGLEIVREKLKELTGELVDRPRTQRSGRRRSGGRP